MNHEGIGLGLAIVKSIVQQHEGVIDVHSDGIGQGSVFHFEMQMDRAVAKSQGTNESHVVVEHDNIQLEQLLD